MVFALYLGGETMRERVGVKTGPGARLVVARGPDAGAQAVVNHEVKIVGRSRDAHLVLSDRTVSRHHFHVHATEQGVYVRVCDGAAPLVVHDREVFEADVSIGDPIVVGDTVMVVVRAWAEDAAAAPPSYRGTTMNLPDAVTGEPSEMRGLASVWALHRALANARDAAELEAAVDGWANIHTGTRARTTDGHGRPPDTEADGTWDDGAALIVPCPGAPTGWIAFQRSAPLSGDVRRLLVLAGALCSSRFIEMRCSCGAKCG